MKKIFLTFSIAVMLFSCSSSDDDLQNSNSINPPNWIQGTWLLGDTGTSSGYRFSNNDFCTVVFNIQSCQKEQLDLFANQNTLTSNVSEIITDSSYSIEITLSSTIITYEFEKVSDTQIRWTNYPISSDIIDAPIYTKQ